MKKILKGLTTLVTILVLLNIVAVAEPTVEPTAEPKDFNAIALNDARLLKSYLKAPDTMVIKGDIYIIEGKNNDISLITYTAQNAYGVPLQETAVFQGNSYVSSLSELEKMPDKLQQEIDAKRASKSSDLMGLMNQRLQILALILEIQSAPLSGNFNAVSGEYIANELDVTFSAN